MPRQHLRLIFCALLTMLSATSMAGQVAELPAPLFEGQISVPPNTFYDSNNDPYSTNSYSLSGCSSSGGCGTGYFIGDYHDGKSTGSVDYSYNGGPTPAGMNAQVTVSFWYEVDGPQAINVPLDYSLSATSNVAGGDSGFAYAVFILSGHVFPACSGVGLYANCSYFGGAFAGAPSSFSKSVQIVMPSQTLFVFEGSAFCGFDANAVQGSAGNCSASFDPQITIDPSFTTPGYSILVSPNLVSNVPEPSNLLLFAVGGFFLMLRRESRRPPLLAPTA